MKTFFLTMLLLYTVHLSAREEFTLRSPDGRLEATIVAGHTIEYSVRHDGYILLAPSPLSMKLGDGQTWGIRSKLTGSSRLRVNDSIKASIYKRHTVLDRYNELTLEFKEPFRIIFRAYNDGLAYRFVATKEQPFTVENEQVEFHFLADPKAYIPYVMLKRDNLEAQYFNSFENQYQHIPLSRWDPERLAFAPLLVEGANGKKICIAEADLLDYPGLFLYNGDGGNVIKGRFAPVPATVEQGGHNLLQGIVKAREPYIAAFQGATTFPWRVVIVSSNDRELADSDMIYKLASPPPARYLDDSWVKPGKVAWEWWNDWGIYGGDFRAGINTETYEFYIDFAARYGLEYVILDEGWAVNKQADLMQIVPEIDLPRLIKYAARRDVGIILWAGYYALNRDIEGIFAHYSRLGVKGFKVDFMDRDDQPMVAFHRRVAEAGAKHKLLVDFHGTYKPTGLQRTYPNVINFEGVFGLEQMKWVAKEVDQVTYDVTFPFIRMIAGPVDYTQGAMRNAGRRNYYPSYSEPMSQGTRCHQLATYVIFESPLSMLCDSPCNYMQDEECTRFIATVPTTWSNTIALDGAVGQYLSIARANGNRWYVGSLNNWNARTVEFDLSFLGEGDFQAECFQDGINADRSGQDYKTYTIDIPADRKLFAWMAPGGGFVMKISPKPATLPSPLVTREGAHPR
ncbi:MAG: glycoside hydrolase family 97 protein [Odoribacteraceae bacterium]|jgi:alpha-glucosidase|nr:glycoside hydrolase family 97 protein [Odoribacteraceae bacterium]